ncbi:delta-type opioid receptor-like [Solea senegalensis]|uniref:Delta-type opioid receptor-like n=1 Tax=Solea senegalensis TaxID=28829 RepID=A0AAV6S330_SOLSE|nr:delta-type opioid receptor-like [Solea senegalensis]
MESALNGSGVNYPTQFPVPYNNNNNNNSGFCGNFTDSNNTASFAEVRCDGDRRLAGSHLNYDDTNPVIIAIVITALYSIVCMVGLVGNVLVMYIIIRYTKMKTATNIYIFNLALADAMVTSTLPFQSVNYLMGTWPFGDLLCKMVMSIDYYNMFTSIFTLTTMSIDRYVAVCHPVKALDFRTPRNAKIVNVCNWILSSAIGLPVMFMASTATYLCVHLCLHHARPHHHRLLRPHDPAAQECAHAVGLPGEGQEPTSDHAHGPGGGCRLHRLLDAHSHLCHHHHSRQHPQFHAADDHLALLHRPWLHKQ